MSLFDRTNQSALGAWWWTVDKTMLSLFLILMICGIALVTTASPPVAAHLGLGDYHFLFRHLVFLVPTVGFMIGLSMLEAQNIRRLATLLYIASVCMMIAVLLTGMEIKGAQRWLHIFGFSIQPSEFIKPAFIVMAAWLMGLQKTKSQFPGNAVTAGLYLVTITLLLLQPDLGMTLVVTSVWAVQIFLAGFPFRLLIGFILLALVGLALAYSNFDHVQSRIDRFLNPEAGDNYQVERSIEAFQSGGIFGTGPGQGEVKLRLPDSHADFIFSVAAEEMGLLFVIILVGIFLAILLRGFNRLMQSPDIFTVLAVGGLLSMFGVQALIHMGSSLNLLPTKGMTLPFLSYGGSSLMATGMAMGAVLALTRRGARSSIARGGLMGRKRYSEADEP